MYSVTDYNSFNSVSTWLEELRWINPDSSVLIVGNKTDLESQRRGISTFSKSAHRLVSTSQGREYATGQEAEFIETSAKEGTNCVLAMQMLLKSMNPFRETFSHMSQAYMKTRPKQKDLTILQLSREQVRQGRAIKLSH